MQPPPSSSTSLLRSVRRATYRRSEVRLPASAQVIDPHDRFAFEVPWPWYEVSPVDLTPTAPLGPTADIVVMAPRTDGNDPMFALTARDDQVDLVAASARSQGRGHAAAAAVRWRSTAKVLVGGAPALLTDGVPSEGPGFRTFLLVAPCDRVLVTGRCDVPAGSADGYRQHLLSMLASWTWAGAPA